MRGHLQCRDTFAWPNRCPYKTGSTVMSLKLQLLLYGIINAQNYISQFCNFHGTLSVTCMDTPRNVSTRTGQWKNFVPVCHKKYCK